MSLKGRVNGILEQFVKKCFQEYVDGVNPNAITYTPHALEEMDNDDIEEQFLEECMSQSELISSHWEFPFQSYKLIFLCEPGNFPPFHVVCLASDKVLVKTAYIVDSTKFENNRKRYR